MDIATRITGVASTYTISFVAGAAVGYYSERALCDLLNRNKVFVALASGFAAAGATYLVFGKSIRDLSGI